MKCPRTVLTLALALLSGPAAMSQSVVTWEGDKVYVDGEPFFYYGFIWQSVGEIEQYARRHFNAFYAGTSAEKVADAQKCGLQVMVGVTTEERMAEFAREPNLLAWFILDDASGAERLATCRERVARVKSVDTAHPTIADENSRTVEGDLPFAELMDIYTPYAYPIPQFTMEWFEHDFLDTLRDGCGHKYVWGAFQCSGIYSRHARMGFTEQHMRMYMEPAQLRLLVWMGISHGMRGIMYWPDKGLFQPEDDCGDRLAEASIIGCELELLGKFIVAGDERRGGARTNRDDVEVCRIDRGDESLLILTKHGRNYQYAVDEALATDVRVTLRPAGDPGRYVACLVSFPEARELPVRVHDGELVIDTGSVHVTDLIMVTRDREHVARLSSGIRARLREVARYGQELVEYFSAKAGYVHHSLQALGVNLPRQGLAGALWERAEARRAVSRGLFKAGLAAASYREARDAEAQYRRLLYLYREHADDFADAVPPDARVYGMMPYSLPEYFASFDATAAP